jgi:hypothetical protein
VRLVLDTAILDRGHVSSKGLARDLLLGIVEFNHNENHEYHASALQGEND